MNQITSSQWMEMLVNILPSIVTIVTIITSAILQVASSKRETERIIAQNKHVQELEKMREEDARKASLLAKQIEEVQNKYSEMLELYYRVSDAFCDLALHPESSDACMAMYSNATKLLGLCEFYSHTRSAVESLTEFIEQHLIQNPSQSEKLFKDIQWRVKAIGTSISDKSIMQAIAEGTTRTEMPQQ